MFFKTNDDEHDHIEKAVEILRMGGVILHETTSPFHRTLSCDATNEVAVKKIISLKGKIQPMQSMVIVQDEEMLEEFIGTLPHFIRQFLHTQEKHVTIIYPSGQYIAPSAKNVDGSVSVRVIPSVDATPIQMSRHVLRLLGKPVFVTTCAIGEGKIPKTYGEISDQIMSGVDIVSPLLFGIDETGNFSMMVKYDQEGHITVLRK